MKNWFYFRDVLAQMVSTFDVRVHVIRLVLLEDQQEAFSSAETESSPLLSQPSGCKAPVTRAPKVEIDSEKSAWNNRIITITS